MLSSWPAIVEYFRNEGWDTEDRARIGKAGQERTPRDHTHPQRMAELHEMIRRRV